MLGSVSLALAALSTLAASPVVLAAPAVPYDGPHNANNPHREYLKRSITADVAQVNGKTFDFVIVGGGLAGLVVANRLSEWDNQTVLVIEAGGDAQDVLDRVSVPGYAYHQGLSSDTPYGWNFSTSEQAECNNGVKKFPLGRGLGGSGAVNGMFWGRAASAEYDAWGNLNPGGEQTWNWAEVDKYIKKAENLRPPTAAQIEQFKIPVDTNAHGVGGPLQVGWSNYIYPVVERWVPTWERLGFKATDHAAGSIHGVTITPSTIDSSTGKRSDSRTAYVEGVKRNNLVVLTNQHVNKVHFSKADGKGNVNATGVEFSPWAGGETFFVNAKKEVIISSGSIGSPAILQRSGVGPADLLRSMDIPVVSDLPVGYNLQEHVAFPMYFDTTGGFDTWANLNLDKNLAASALEEWRKSGTGPWTYLNEAVGYVAASDISGGPAAVAAVADRIDVDALVAQVTARHNLPSTVANGLRTQYYIQRDWHKSGDIGQFEIIFHLWGRGATSLAFQVALQHPWSRGRVSISSADPFAMPVINPDYFSVGLDVQNMNDAAVWVRKMASTAPMSEIMVAESAPGAGVTGDALTNYFKDNAGTEYHPLGTNAMLPKADGGVVDTNLRVYGTNNLRVIDASIMPMQVSAHLMASTYGIAEKGSDIIKSQNQYIPPPPPPVAATSTSKAPSTLSSADAAATKSADNSAATAGSASANAETSTLSNAAKIGIAIAAVVVGLALLMLIIFFCMKKRQDAAPKGEWQQNLPLNQNQPDTYPMQDGLRHRHQESVSTMATYDLHPQQGQPRLYQHGGSNY